MTVRKVIENKAFKGQRVFARRGNPKIRVLATGTAIGTTAGVVAYSVATTGCYVAVDTSGTGTKFNV